METLILTKNNLEEELDQFRLSQLKEIQKVIQKHFGGNCVVYTLGSRSMSIAYREEGYTNSLAIEFGRGKFHDEGEGEFNVGMNVMAMGTFDIQDTTTREYKYYSMVGKLLYDTDLKKDLKDYLQWYYDTTYKKMERIVELRRDIKKRGAK